MTKKVLVTGSSGFVGRTIQAMMRRDTPDPELQGWSFADLPPGLDIKDADSLHQFIAEAKPDAVIHLAAQSHVPNSFRDPRATFDVNFYGTYSLLTALRDGGFSGRLLYVSSGDVYGLVPENELPIRETRTPAPRNPYAVSKTAAEMLCGQWVHSERMDIVVARPFNHIGPGQDRRFALADFAAQLVSIQQGKASSELSVGDIEVTRDFLDVHDVIRAYFALLSGGVKGATYNICSGKERTIRSIVEQMASLLDIKVNIVVDSSRLRPSEQRRVMGDPTRLRSHTGWAPREPFDSTLVELINYWKEDRT